MYRIELSEKQIKIISDALELISRMRCGDMSEITRAFRDRIIFRDEITHHEVEIASQGLKRALFKELRYDASYGILSEEAPEDAKIAYDIIQVLRNRLAWDSSPEGGMGVDFHEPIKTSEEDLPKIERSG